MTAPDDPPRLAVARHEDGEIRSPLSVRYWIDLGAAWAAMFGARSKRDGTPGEPGVFPSATGGLNSDHGIRRSIRWFLRSLRGEILDVGAGARPSIPLGRRPADVRYVGLDISATELEKAPVGAYDEVAVGDLVQQAMPSLEGRFDLVLCARTLEHVRSTPNALAVLRRYLRPGGELLAETSGTFAVFALLNRIIPPALGRRALHRLTGREPDTVFPAYYDHSWYDALVSTLSAGGWSQYEVTPLFYGGSYFAFWRPALSSYLAVEGYVFMRGMRNAATHYIIHAIR